MWPFYAYKLLCDFLVIVPVMVPFYAANGLTAEEILQVQAVYSVTQLLCEIPSGYLADVIGRKHTLVLGSALFVAGLTLYALSHGFWQFAFAEFVLGIAGSMRSGTDSALLYDTLKERGTHDQYQRFEGRAESLTRIGTAASAVLGGLLAAVALRLPFWINVGSAALMLGFTFFLREPVRERRPRGNALGNILGVVKTSVASPRLRVVMLLSGLVLATGITAIWGYFLYYEEAGVPVAAYGVLFALFQLSSGAGAHRAASIESRLGSRALLLPLATTLVLLPFALVQSPWLASLAFGQAFVWGMSTPLLLARINRLASSEVRATTLSTGAMFGRVLYISMGLGFGALATRVSLSAAFCALALLFGLAASALIALLLGQERGEAAVSAPET